MLWIKAFHIIFAVAWFAGLLYLPRLFVYHAQCEDAAGRARFALMESRLYWRIMLPAMLGAVCFGTLLLRPNLGLWLPLKLALVAALAAFHFWCGRYIRAFAVGPGSPRGALFFRFFNEAPALLLIGIVVLAVVKPF